ncbi:hypothetical protein [Pseudooceanicola onchidii]|uniref:hypothetical protein n=1 Tax=Pseudooceanicola onchidii TaxID=2562279 RepID=UPI0010AAD2EB|nr:hypothetical protein [Pseudooceanicola onchidii]
MKRAVIILALLPGPLLADGNIGGKTIDCYCTDKTGSRVELGETICLEVDGRMFMAQCQMSLNVPMWREMQEGCATSDIRPLMTPRPGAIKS